MKTSEPKEQVIEYRETVFLCANSGHDARSVYLWRGNWYCSDCLKRTVGANGATGEEARSCSSSWYTVGRPEFRAEAVKRAAPMQRVTPRNDLPKKPKRGKAEPEFCEYCETNHEIGCCPL